MSEIHWDGPSCYDADAIAVVRVSFRKETESL